jgi:glutathione peroxidase
MARSLLVVMCLVATAACGRTRTTPQGGPAAGGETEATVEGGRGVINHTVQTLAGETVNLASYRGKTLLIVNTASQCGYTPQYDGLEKLYTRYQEKGLVVLGFPSNDFGSQEPGTAEEIASFCKKNFGVSFPLFAKVHAKGPEMAPLYRTLTEATPAGISGPVKWNFTKFLVDPAGDVVARFEPNVEPLSPELTTAIERHLPR